MIRLYMNVMLSVWKWMVNFLSKKKKPPVVWAVIQKTRILQCFSFGLEGFFRILNSVSFGFGLVLTDLDFRLDLWFLFGLDRLFLSDWIYQKYKDRASGESEGTLDFIVSLRIVYLHKPHNWLKINRYDR